MKNNPQYIVIIDVINDNVSKSFSSTVLKGCFLKLTIRKNIKIINTIKAWATIPKFLIKIAVNIIAIFLYMITISQKKYSFLYPLYKKPYFYLISTVSRFFLEFTKIAKAKNGIPRPHSIILGRATK